MTVRIAMWSGPRNISTAMMRAWENRPDTVVVDEPFYACYLAATGLAHPGRADVLASQPTDWRAVVADVTGPPPDGAAVFYQKHMAHHLLPDMDVGWLDHVTNCFLIRDPDEVAASYARTRAAPTAEDLGFVQQAKIFERVADRIGRAPPVLDARDVLKAPHHLLTLLCGSVGVPFSERMLHWPAGRRDSDGVWAPHWYASVERSTGFAPYRPPAEPLPDALRPQADACRPAYEKLYAHRLGAAND